MQRMKKAEVGPRDAQKCAYCDGDATHSVIWDGGHGFIPACDEHHTHARNTIRLLGGSIIDTYQIANTPVGFSMGQGVGTPSEHRMWEALQPVPREIFHSSGGYGLGQRVNAERCRFMEQDPPEAVTGQPETISKPVSKDQSKKKIPSALLQMLGTPWKTMRVYRVHDNRMNVTIDGIRYTLYTRRG
jgi:hypothetical protein